MSPRRQGLILLGRVTRIEGAVAHLFNCKVNGRDSCRWKSTSEWMFRLLELLLLGVARCVFRHKGLAVNVKEGCLMVNFCWLRTGGFCPVVMLSY